MHIDNAFMRTYVQAAAAASIGKLGFSLKDRFFFAIIMFIRLTFESIT